MSDGEAKPAKTPPPPPTPPNPETNKPPATPESPPHALVVDDEPANCDFLVRLLQQAPMVTKGALTGQEALALAEADDQLVLIVIDHRLPDMTGVELLVRLRDRYPNAMFVMATMHDERSLMERAFENGCDVFLVKPHGFMELYKRLKENPLSNGYTHERLIIDQYGPRPYRG